jgi:tetratricopeptide (TPR) repeat protein
MRTALRLDPQSTVPRRALDTLGPDGVGVGEVFDHALQLMDTRRWQEASDVLSSVIRETPGHLPARVARHRAEQRLAEARQAYGRGQKLLQQTDLAEAEAAFRDALGIWPFYAEAVADLEQTRSAIAAADRECDRAQALLERGEWDQAILISGGVLDSFRSCVRAAALLESARVGAADSWVRAGESALATGDWDGADTAFLRALTYVPEHTTALSGYASVPYRRGELALAQGRPGAAWAWFRWSLERHPLPEVRQALGRVEERLRARAGLTVSVLSQQSGEGIEGGVSATFRQLLVSRLRSALPGAVEVVDASAGHYTVGFALGEIRIEQEQTGVESDSYPYTVFHLVPNPELPRLRDLLIHAEHRLVFLEERYRSVCDACGGRGWRRCERCRGEGRLRCSHCRGTGTLGEGAERGPCPHCRGTGFVGCPDCRDGRVDCRHCGGTGRGSDVSRHDVDRQRTEVRRLRRAFESEPDMIEVGEPAYWPYRIEHYRKQGTGVAVVRLLGADGGELGRCGPDSLVVAEDSVIDGANSEIGLAPDPLTLPSNDEMLAQVLLDLAGKSSAGMATEIRSAAARAAYSEADRADVPEPTEALADLLFTLRWAAPGDSAAAEARLMDAVRR